MAGLEPSLAARVKSLEAQLPEAILRVARYLDRERAVALTGSAAQIGRATGTSDATVVRTAKALGFTGLADLRAHIAFSLAEHPTASVNMARTLAAIAPDSADAIGAVLSAHSEALHALSEPDSRAALVGAVSILHGADRIVLFGVGQTRPLTDYGAIMLNRAGRRATTCNASGTALADQLLDLQSGDALLIMAYGTAYPEVEAVFGEAERLGLPTILLSDSLDPALAIRARLVVPVRRGRTDQIALHAATLAALEAIALGIAAIGPALAVETLRRLDRLRAATGAKPKPARRKADPPQPAPNE